MRSALCLLRFGLFVGFGTAMTANTPWVITPDQNQVLLPGCVIELVATKASSAANLDELSATVIWHWEEA